MKYTINSGVYQVDLQGSTPATFKGKHPSVIIQTLYEETVFYIIPLTTFTEGRWEELRRKGCCKIPSTNSIARIDKMQVRERNDIPQRYYDNYRLVVPTYNEMLTLHQKIKDYINLSLDKSARAYQKFYTDYTTFSEIMNNFVENYPVISCPDILVESTSPLSIIYPLSKLPNLSFDDMKNIINSCVKSASTAYDKNKNQLKISNIILK